MKTKVPVINAPMKSKAREPFQVEAAPGERVVWLKDEQINRRFGVFVWQKLGDGTYAPVVRVYDTLVRISEVSKIGVHIPWDTMRRLVTGGFVKSTQPSPSSIHICIDSLMTHLEAAEDPEFWTEERRRRYSAAVR